MVDRRTNRSRGFGFVRFGNGVQGNAASEAVLMDFASHHLAGKWVEVKRATPASQLQEMFPYEGLEDEIYCGMSAEDIIAAASMGMPLPDYIGLAGWDSSPCAESTPMSLGAVDASSGVSARSHARGRRARRRKQRGLGDHEPTRQNSGSTVDAEDFSDDGSSPLSTSMDTPHGEVAFVSTANNCAAPAGVALRGCSATGLSEPRALGTITVSALAERLAGARQQQHGSGSFMASENDPRRANTTASADQPMKVTAGRDVPFTREDFLSLEVRPWLSAW
jgi:hypothetical protein